MRESSFELAARLRSEAEALEELFLDGEHTPSYQSRLEEESRLEDLLSLAQDRLATLRLEALQEGVEDVEIILRGLREDETRRTEEGRPLQLVQSFIKLAEAERVRLHHIIDAAVRAEEDSRRMRERSRQYAAKERPYSQERPPVRRESREPAKQQPTRARKVPVREVMSDLDSA